MTADVSGYVLDHAAAGGRIADDAVIEADTGRRISYGGLRNAVDRAAAQYTARGLRPGDAVGVRVPNGIGFVVALHAVLSAGGCVVPVNPCHPPPEVRRQLSLAGAEWTIEATGDSTTAGPLDRITPPVPPADPIARSAGLALLPSSSGTTGRPKTVGLTHTNLIAALAAGTAALPLAPDDRVLAALPLSHGYGLQAVLHHTLRCGGTVVTLARYTPQAAVRALGRQGITRLFAVPPMLRTLCAEQRRTRAPLNALRSVHTGGAPAAAALLMETRQALGAPVLMGYGLTETAGYVAVAAGSGPDAGQSAPFVPGIEHRVVSGELWVRGPQVAPGSADGDGWLRTGDLVCLDGGELRITGRCKELIKTNGYQVTPIELEEILIRHPQVADAAVTAVADPNAGEVPVAYVVLHGPVALEGLAAFVNSEVAPYKRLRRVHAVEVIPRTASGKIMRHRLVGAGGTP
ncbi:AMP-binding protein [Streptomyces sp. NPDC004610]|uniref:class I adenylate-forming enzyme family protein n=1 Tax=unclassified Streptomyces TaxID=2593676 RepID=UPI0033B69EE4